MIFKFIDRVLEQTDDKIVAIKNVSKERLKVSCELFFLKTPRINKNIIEKETNISGNTKLRLYILLARYI